MTYITTPFAWLLRAFYDLFNNYGLALIVFALVLILIRLPFDMRSKRSQMQTSFLAPKQQKLKEKYGENTQKYNEELQKLYKEENINPLGGCLWTLIPLVILIILYQVVRQPLAYLMGLSADQIELVAKTLSDLGKTIDTSSAWSQIYIAQVIPDYFQEIKAAVPGVFNLSLDFFGGINLGDIPKWNFFLQDGWTVQDLGLFLLPILSMGVSIISQKLTMAMSFQQQQQSQQSTMKTMMIIGPVISVWIGFSYPAALSLYWLAQNVFTTVSSFFLNRHFKTVYDTEMEKREASERIKEAELEAKRKETERLKALGIMDANKNTSKKKQKTSERQKEAERQAAIERAKSGKDGREDELGRVGNRRFARGRAYDSVRFEGEDGAMESTEEESTQPGALDSEREEPSSEAARPVDALSEDLDSEGAAFYDDGETEEGDSDD